MTFDEIGAVLTYHTRGRRGVTGATIGAEAAGTFCEVIVGDPEKAVHKAADIIRTLERSGHIITFSAIVRSDEIGYTGSHLRLTQVK